MKILILSWYFPPANTIGAVRLGGLAEYLHEAGHDIRVVCADQIPENQTLTTSFPESQVIRTHHVDFVNCIMSYLRFSRGVRHNENKSDTNEAAKNMESAGSGLLSYLKSAVQEVLTFPDKRNGWISYGVRAARDLIRNWQPDLVFASGPHFSTLVIAHIVTKGLHLPLICEFRDRWWDDPYGEKSSLKRFLERHCEAHIVRSARAISTVSQPWAETYRDHYGKPVVVIANGYDEMKVENANFPCPFNDSYLNIIYTGGIYPIHRDPSPLFSAIAQNSDLSQSVIVWFYGTEPQHVVPLIEKYSIAKNIKILPAVPHDEAVYLQHKADVLLLMQWNDPREQGNVPGKFFEYLGARRPILLMGLEGGVPDTILRERGAGQICNSPEAIAEYLRSWLAIKAANGAIPDVDPSASAGFSRREQYEKLRIFLEDLCAEV